MTSAPPRVAVVAQDLMVWSRLSGTVRAAGLEPLQVKSPTGIRLAHETRPLAAVIVDLKDPAGGIDAVQEAKALGGPLVVAIGPHVETALLDQARKAGAEHALPHSATGETLKGLLSARRAPA